MSNLRYLPDPGLKAAVEMAIEMEIPLFVTGEPGTGKTELAYWIAENEAYQKEFGLSGEVLRFNVKTSSAAKDLLYRYDAIRHFRDSQRHPLPFPPASGEEARQEVNVLGYVQFEALGQAILAARAEPSQRRLVLVDEIDKAPRDFPNDLLFEFDKLGFRIEEATEKDLNDPDFKWSELPLFQELGLEKPPFEEQDFIFYTEKADRSRPRLERKVKKPVLVLTSNSEKNLPDAFLRRCAFYHIPFPEDRQRLLDILKEKRLFDEGKGKELVGGAVDFFLRLRKEAGLRRKPATAELIAWVEFLRQLKINPEKTLTAAELERIAPSLSLLGKNKEDLDRIISQLKKA